MAESTGHFKCRILFYLCIFFGMAFVVGICAPAGAGSTPAYGAHPAITNISPQNTDPGVVSPVTHTGSISNAIPVTFTTDPVTKRSYVSNHIIVRFKSRNDGGLSVSADKIQTAHAKAGAKVLKDFSAGGLTGLQLVQLVNGTNIQTAIKEYQSDPDVLYAEPDYEISITRDETARLSRARVLYRLLHCPMIPISPASGLFTIPDRLLKVSPGRRVRISMQRLHGVSQPDRTRSLLQ